MTRHKLFKFDSKIVRDQLLKTTELSDQILFFEEELIKLLYEMDVNRYYVRVGFKSLSGFCHIALKLPKTQTQRIVTLVRRYEPTANIGQDGRLITGTQISHN